MLSDGGPLVCCVDCAERGQHVADEIDAPAWHHFSQAERAFQLSGIPGFSFQLDHT